MRFLWAILACTLACAAPAQEPAAAPAAESAPAAQAEPLIELTPLEQVQTQAVEYAEGLAAAQAGQFAFRVVRPPQLPRLPGTGKLTFTPDHASRSELAGPFFITFKAFMDDRPVGYVRVDLDGRWTGKLLRARSALPRKTAVDASQFDLEDFAGDPPAGALGTVPAGWQLRCPLTPGHILVQQDLEPIPVVLAGEAVRLELESGSLTIAVDALARNSGAVGAKVRVEVSSSHKEVQAVVTGPGTARVEWAGGF